MNSKQSRLAWTFGAHFCCLRYYDNLRFAFTAPLYCQRRTTAIREFSALGVFKLTNPELTSDVEPGDDELVCHRLHFIMGPWAAADDVLDKIGDLEHKRL